ncbi:ankyrin repeat-containing domain protein [Trichoderma chlorosporum]
MEETPAHHTNESLIPRDTDGPSNSRDAAFEQVLLRIDEKLQPQAVSSLKWLAFSFESLTLNLLTKVLAQHTDGSDETEKRVSARTVLDCLSGLVIADERTVRLADSCIKGYLTCSRTSHGPASAFSFTEAEAHLHIAHSSLIHHLQCNPPGLANAPENDEEHNKASGLRSYAARNWPLHLERVPRSSWPRETARAANLALAVCSPSLFCGIKALGVRPFLATDAWVNPLLYTAHLGLTQLTEMLLAEGLDMHEYITQWDLDEALLAASAAGKLETVRLLLDKGVGVDAENAAFRNPLIEAARGGHTATVRFLLESEAMAAVLKDGGVCKMALDAAAAREDNFDVMELLVRHGTKIDRITLGAVAGSPRDEVSLLECLQLLLDNSEGITKERALCKAAYREKWKAFELLLSKGADINIVPSRWGTPLHIACAAQDVDESRIKYLLDLGADPNIQAEQHGTALQAVCYSYAGRDEDACIKIAKLLIARGVDINAEGGECGSALINACASRGKDDVCWYNMVEMLLKAGADVNAQGGPYANALQVACHMGNSDLVPLLLAWGADVNAQGGAFTTALHAACFTRPKEGKEGDVKMVQLLLDHGADVNLTPTAKNKSFGTALQAACAAGNMKLVRLLLEHGAKVNLQSGHGSALQSACQWGHTDIVRLLLDVGADVNALGRKIGSGTATALLTACSFARSNDEIVHLLLDHGAKMDVPGTTSGPVLHAAASSDGIKDTSVLLRLLKLGADINQIDERRGTALHCVLQARFESRETKPSRIRFLIEHGADVHLAAGEFGSPLHCICAVPKSQSDVYENDRTTALLLEICPEIDVNAQGGKYGSALQAAAWSGQAESINLIIKKGADANRQGGKYVSALNAAIIQGHWNIVKILLENGAKPDFHWRSEPDEDWLAEVYKDHGRGAVERYEKFWDVEKRKYLAETMQI